MIHACLLIISINNNNSRLDKIRDAKKNLSEFKFNKGHRAPPPPPFPRWSADVFVDRRRSSSSIVASAADDDAAWTTAKSRLCVPRLQQVNFPLVLPLTLYKKREKRNKVRFKLVSLQASEHTNDLLHSTPSLFVCQIRWILFSRAFADVTVIANIIMTLHAKVVHRDTESVSGRLAQAHNCRM